MELKQIFRVVMEEMGGSSDWEMNNCTIAACRAFARLHTCPNPLYGADMPHSESAALFRIRKAGGALELCRRQFKDLDFQSEPSPADLVLVENPYSLLSYSLGIHLWEGYSAVKGLLGVQITSNSVKGAWSWPS